MKERVKVSRKVASRPRNGGYGWKGEAPLLADVPDWAEPEDFARDISRPTQLFFGGVVRLVAAERICINYTRVLVTVKSPKPLMKRSIVLGYTS